MVVTDYVLKKAKLRKLRLAGDCGDASVSHDTKLDVGRNACKPTETCMFYDPLLAAGVI
jgi:hypothetical protein